MFLVGLIVAVVGLQGRLLHAREEEAHVHLVDIDLFTFAPVRIEVEPGDSVEWTNRDLVPHTATADDSEWTTGEIKNGATGRFIPGSAGTYAYHCTFHPQMTGVIVVVARARQP
jgi:plastocyanin